MMIGPGNAVTQLALAGSRNQPRPPAGFVFLTETAPDGRVYILTDDDGAYLTEPR